VVSFKLVRATSESLIDTGLTSATLYYYSLQYTDTSTGATGLTAQVAVTTSAGNTQEVVGGIGDSIMAGSFSTFETPFNAMLDQLNYKISTSQFTGVNRAISGTTSTDWASTTAGSALLNAVAAFVSAGVTRIVLMLGTNDSKASVATAPNAYQSNIQTIVNYVFAHVPSLKTVHMFSSPFQSLTSGDLSIQNCGRLIAYANTLASIANGTTVFYSEPLASYNLFQNDPSLLRDGIHPTDLGDQTMGGLWGSNVASDLGSGATTAAGYSRSRVVNGG
jgi:lysophospholipase L1-like esterase